LGWQRWHKASGTRRVLDIAPDWARYSAARRMLKALFLPYFSTASITSGITLSSRE
jgi:hypothetical protein